MRLNSRGKCYDIQNLISHISSSLSLNFFRASFLPPRIPLLSTSAISTLVLPDSRKFPLGLFALFDQGLKRNVNESRKTVVAEFSRQKTDDRRCKTASYFCSFSTYLHRTVRMKKRRSSRKSRAQNGPQEKNLPCAVIRSSEKRNFYPQDITLIAVIEPFRTFFPLERFF